jgi:hypothetical protein
VLTVRTLTTAADGPQAGGTILCGRGSRCRFSPVFPALTSDAAAAKSEPERKVELIQPDKFARLDI